MLLTGCGGPVEGSPDTPAPRQPRPAEPAPDPTPMSAEGATSASGSTRCRTAELRASVGHVSPGAGQRNHPIVLTNASARTCTLYGYPGAAFVDAAGERLGPDPRRAPERPATVRLAPGERAWAGLSFAHPEISGAETATPAALLVTPPDEYTPLRVVWTAGPVAVSGNASGVPSDSGPARPRGLTTRAQRDAAAR